LVRGFEGEEELVLAVVVVETGFELVLVGVGVLRRGDVKGRALSAKTSPDTRIGTRSPKVDVRISRASRLIGVLDGVDLVRGCIVRKSICRFVSGPRTVVIKSIVLLYIDSIVS
jgi:hypothetical protein